MTRHYTPTSHVGTSVLEGIVRGDYEQQLTAEETALIIERVPPGKRPWFEEVVVKGFYLPLRGIMKQPTEVLARLIVEVFQKEIERAQDNGDRIKRRPTLRGSFEYVEEHRKYSGLKNPPGNMTFEELIGNVLTAYREVTRDNIMTFLRSGDSFRYVSPYQMRTSIARQMR